MFCVHLAASRQTYSLIGIFLRNELERLAKACKGGIRKDLTMAYKVPSRVTRSDSELHLLHNWRCLRLEKLSPRISCPIRSLVHRQITIYFQIRKGCCTKQFVVKPSLQYLDTKLQVSTNSWTFWQLHFLWTGLTDLDIL